MKRIMLIKPVPNNHYVELLSIAQVYKETDKAYYIHTPDEVILKVYKHEAKEVEGRFVKLSEIARCIKYMELLKWRLLSPEFASSFGNGKRPIEYYWINEFPFGSAFCYLFRKIKTKIKFDGEFTTCFCPKKPFTHPEWARIANPVSQDSQATEPPHISCVCSGDLHHRPVKEIIKEIEDIPIMDIMEYVKKIKFTDAQKYKLCMIWHFFVWQRVSIHKTEDNKDFIKGYKL
jgi:hypothetical protein